MAGIVFVFRRNSHILDYRNTTLWGHIHLDRARMNEYECRYKDLCANDCARHPCPRLALSFYAVGCADLRTLAPKKW
jgi:hypothetical protein